MASEIAVVSIGGATGTKKLCSDAKPCYSELGFAVSAQNRGTATNVGCALLSGPDSRSRYTLDFTAVKTVTSPSGQVRAMPPAPAPVSAAVPWLPSLGKAGVVFCLSVCM